MVQVVLPAFTSRIAKRRAFGSGLPEDRAQPVDPRPGEVRRHRPDRPEVRRRPQRELLRSQRADHLREAVIRQPPAVIETDEVLLVSLHIVTVLFRGYHWAWSLPGRRDNAGGSVRSRPQHRARVLTRAAPT